LFPSTRRWIVNSGELQTQGRELIGVAPLPAFDCQMCRVSFLVIGAGLLAVLLGWTAAGAAAVLFGLLALWLAAQLAAAPCDDEEPIDG